MTAMFIAIEGPNAVGKTTVTGLLAASGATRIPGIEIVATMEPTRSPLGAAIRSLEGDLPPRALALSCAADRFDHVEREIRPALARGAWVVSDRYLPSSLVLQRLDGMDIEEIWRLNQEVLRPHLTVYLHDDPVTIAQRLEQRGRRNRFEREGSPEIELQFYEDAYGFLDRHGWTQIRLDCRRRTPNEVVEFVMRAATGS